MIFVYTGAWFASIVPWDANHAAAADWLRQNQETLITTDFVLDETLTLLRARKESERALMLGKELFSQELAELYFLQEPELREAWDVFRHFDDKEWSFTDCTSKVLIQKLGLKTAFTFDQHFRQFGTVQVLP
jgi:uncharacterized protein